MIDETTIERIAPREIKRPLGVWILTIWDGLFAGLLPVITVLILYFNAEVQAALGMSVLDLVLSILLGIAVVIAAIGAWLGNNAARIALVILVSVHYGLLAFNNVNLATAGVLSGTAQVKSWGRAFRSVVWIGINVWYFLGKRPRAYYDRG